MKIGIIGTGRLGLCVALTLRNAGFEVVAMDKNSALISELNLGSFRSNEPGVEENLVDRSLIRFTDCLEEVLHEDIYVLMVFVATPSNSDGSFSHESIDNIVNDIENKGKRKTTTTLVIGSTVMPGYTTTVAQRLSILNYDVVYNPEFIAQGSILNDLIKPDQVLIGEVEKRSGDRLVDIYKRFLVSNPTFCRMDPISAEITKLATNCFLTTKISFANAIGDLTIKMGGDQDAVLSAIGSDSRIGPKYLNYGFGFGGPCFPRDNQALISAASSFDIPLLIAEATVNVNASHLMFQLNQLLDQQLDTYVFDYITYKPGTDILEESQQLKLAILLREKGKNVVVKNGELVRSELEKRYPGYFEFL
jgi:nucleotide sugar dehydrogenase